MNERIKELAEQVTTIEEYGWGANFENFDREKFAELIVRECALIAGLMEHEGRKNIGAQILDAFGVD
jgi:hypothetical protein